jgi:hypothetical protein
MLAVAAGVWAAARFELVAMKPEWNTTLQGLFVPARPLGSFPCEPAYPSELSQYYSKRFELFKLWAQPY